MSLVMGAQLAAEIQTGLHAIEAGLLSVPGGTFTMGAEDLGIPEREVTVDSFKMGKYTVTNEEYDSWVKSLGAERFFLLRYDSKTDSPSIVARASSKEEVFGSGVFQIIAGELIQKGGLDFALQIVEIEDHHSPENFDRPNQPGVSVSWYDSITYALMHGARLATEEEWEYAATEGGKKKYATPSGKLTNEEVHFNQDIEKGTTIDVDDPRYPDGPFGIRHLTGNVWEWTGSSWAPGSPLKVLRGGSWNDDILDDLRAACRSYGRPEVSDGYFGFRLVVRRQDSSK
ncbi:MAG: hypothetical protein A2W61_05045 [Deltaproteobacteria bacterium RIFCSPLOWO2_01_44_7]|nr:MAG: hypothetical protein A2712_09225 [Deltaproteobacteria bacterium RIFCSPHIGHO2_01_FULL_43_49]OGQ14464.1 MAG: hypothetical protein A3D22_09650 [Deltaproteobacteria bacterium RIFCSPHIGHO2_02_FULL_44_53]OGQ27845.1 MAG: hypothetical protein A3D98_04050 [Deltaproteobacteria bacterium RIFCSPHIGHO2_12_FULL_44_21]OGQ30921.1 MAG: hypothetical protein A2979_01725 [Deltaproteobacteria bacterium RIFCSPLOWO2_01_FULL_45_74]OGQ41148.1 MAG: hypothetical protein A2W61_05045 [Deltaproteobacteria bacterium 